jgi:hypothetical protein
MRLFEVGQMEQAESFRSGRATPAPGGSVSSEFKLPKEVQS